MKDREDSTLLNSFDEQAMQLAKALESTDVKKYAGKGILDLIRLVVFKDPGAALELGNDGKEFLYSVPAAMFWQKMQRFLSSCFRNRDEQIAFSSKFSSDDEKYRHNIKRLIHAIDSMESDESIDYLAQLTRYACLFNMDMPLYFRLVKCIQNCTTEELNYLRDISVDGCCANNALVSMLLLQGLMEQESNEKNGSYYKPSSIGIALKECSLNYNDTDSRTFVIPTYSEMEGISQIETITNEDIDNIISTAIDMGKPELREQSNGSGDYTLVFK